jgi:hypothetical protein
MAVGDPPEHDPLDSDPGSEPPASEPPKDADKDKDEEQEHDRPSPTPRRASEPPGRRRRLEGVIPELLKRAIEVGYEKATDMPEQLRHLPKEAASYIFSQVEETKNGVLRVVAKEVRDFLEHTNLAGEMSKVLTTLQFEINTTIRFRPNSGSSEEGGTDEESGELPKPEVKLDMYTRKRERKKGQDK